MIRELEKRSFARQTIQFVIGLCAFYWGRDVGGRLGEATIVVFRGPKDEASIVLQMKSASKLISTGDLLDAMKPGGKAKKQ